MEEDNREDSPPLEARLQNVLRQIELRLEQHDTSNKWLYAITGVSIGVAVGTCAAWLLWWNNKAQ